MRTEKTCRDLCTQVQVDATSTYIPLFLYEKRIPRAQMEEFRGKLTGLREQG